MIESRDFILDKLRGGLRADKPWRNILENFGGFSRLHLAIFSDPYLDWIENGSKTIESRFSKNRIAPFEQIAKGDIILLKRSGGGVKAICLVDKVWFYNIEPSSLDVIREEFGKGICPASKEFWDERRDSNFCSLIWVSKFTKIPELPVNKRDRRGWVIFK